MARSSLTPLRWLLMAYAVLNALLYSMLLPLWEGFDEPFHFGYVQQLADLQGWPDPRISLLSAEVSSSLLLAPASYPVKVNLPQVPAFADYYRLSLAERAAIRRRLRGIPTASRRQPGDFVNYEGLQPPLAYILIAAPERMLSRVPLPARVPILRFLVATASALALLAGAANLFRALRIPPPHAAAATFCVLSCQMLWATIAHIGNDWLAVPLAVWLLFFLIRYHEKPGGRAAALAAGALAAGLLTKAYFLVALPLLLFLCAWRKQWRHLAFAVAVLCAVGGPWHARNLRRYGDLTGTMETQSVGLRRGLQAAATMPWPSIAGSAARRALWTGNNSGIAYSATTLNLLIAAVLLGWAIWGSTRQYPADRIALAYCGLFGLVLAYGSIFAWLSTNGAVKGPQAWYWQPIAPALFGMSLLGASRRPAIGRYLASAVVLLSGYVLVATYFVKLIPWYAGYTGRATLPAVAGLYARGLSDLRSNLDSVASGPASAILLLAAAVAVLAIWGQILLVRELWDQRPSSGSVR